MKSQSNQVFTSVNNTATKQLLTVINNNQTSELSQEKSFTNSDLWNILRSKKRFQFRRNFA